MNTYVLDTSVAVAWYLNEAFSLSARAWQERLLGNRIQLTVPSLHYWEFSNVMRTMVMRGELEQNTARDIYDLHLEAPLDLVEPEKQNVLRVAMDYGSTAYDAVYICIALEQGIPLLTAEKTTTPWVVKLGKQIEPVRY